MVSASEKLRLMAEPDTAKLTEVQLGKMLKYETKSPLPHVEVRAARIIGIEKCFRGCIVSFENGQLPPTYFLENLAPLLEAEPEVGGYYAVTTKPEKCRGRQTFRSEDSLERQFLRVDARAGELALSGQ